MPNPSPPDPTPTNPNDPAAEEFDPLPIPTLDPTFFSSDAFAGLFDTVDDPGDFDFDFNFDNFDLPPDTEEFLNYPLTSPVDPIGSDPPSFSTDPLPDVTSGGGCEFSKNGFGDQKLKLEEEGNNCLLKRKRASEDVNSELRSNAGGNADPAYGMDSTGDDENKKKVRLMRNRESAQLSRRRKKHYVEELEDEVRSMHSTIQDLISKNSYIMAENVSLRQQLGGVAMCLPPPMLPLDMHMHMAPMGYPWMMACPPYVVKPHGSQVPLVPIPRLKPPQPASAPRSKKVESNKKSEGRTKKVASVSFLGLLFFSLFFGGLAPMVNVKFGVIQGRVSGGSDYLGSRFYEMQRGRVLTVNVHLNGSDRNVGIGPTNGMFGGARGHVGKALANVVKPGNSSEPLVASFYVPRNRTTNL